MLTIIDCWVKAYLVVNDLHSEIIPMTITTFLKFQAKNEDTYAHFQYLHLVDAISI